MAEKPRRDEVDPTPPSAEKESRYKQTFRKNDLAILESGYGGFKVGIQNFRAHETPVELRLVTIRNFPTTPRAGDIKGIWENIQESLPDGEIDLETFKSTVRDVVSTLFEDRKVDVEFPDDKYFLYAIQCMVEDSLGPAKNAGKDVSEGVRKIFGFAEHQFYE